jgi:hypothetical protein
MMAITRTRIAIAAACVVAIVLATAVTVTLILIATEPSSADRAPGESAEPPARPLPSEGALCEQPTITVGTGVELQAALDGATPGDTIKLAPGTFFGNFGASVDGSADLPIALCGGPDSVLDGGGTRKGYVLHLDGVAHWQLEGFAVRNGQKGLMADGVTSSIIRGLSVSTIGDEGIHLRRFSTDNVISSNHISDTGLRKEKFGEGIYIGSSESNWCSITDCEPDRSDRNVVEANVIERTTSESIDVKEGTSDGILRGNTFDGSEISAADSWVDIKGNGWLIEDNSGVNSPLDGFQTHEILDGWGTDNTFRGNSAAVNGSGFGFSLTPVRDNVVTCTNTVSAAAEGFSNIDCSG